MPLPTYLRPAATVVADYLRDAAKHIPAHATTLTEVAERCLQSLSTTNARAAVEAARAAVATARTEMEAAERMSGACASDGAARAEACRADAALDVAEGALHYAEVYLAQVEAAARPPRDEDPASYADRFHPRSHTQLVERIKTFPLLVGQLGDDEPRNPVYRLLNSSHETTRLLATFLCAVFFDGVSGVDIVRLIQKLDRTNKAVLLAYLGQL